MSEWCQNKKCPEKQTQSQIRGSKGAKYYQSNKAQSYLGYWCSNGCRDQWWNEHKTTCMNAVGFIDKQVIPVGNAWYVQTYGDYDQERGSFKTWKLVNLLKKSSSDFFFISICLLYSSGYFFLKSEYIFLIILLYSLMLILYLLLSLKFLE